MKKAGGRLLNLSYHFGEYHGTIIFEAPGDLDATAGVPAAIASGHAKSIKTTRFFTMEETMEAGAELCPPHGLVSDDVFGVAHFPGLPFYTVRSLRLCL